MKISGIAGRMALLVGVSFCGVSAAHAQMMPMPQAPNFANAQRASGGSGKASIAILPQTGNGKLQNPLPSSVEGDPATPLSSQKMPLSSGHIDAQVSNVMSQAQARLKNVHVGDGNMPDEHEDSGTLAEEIRTAKELRSMTLEQAKVDAAMKLWKSAYDGERENAGSVSNGSGDSGVMGMSGGLPPEQQMALAAQEKKKAAAEEKNQEMEDAREHEEMLAKKHADFIRERRSLAASIPPVISSIYGATNDLKASILVPYVGEQDVSKGDSVPFVDGHNGKVTKITPTQVVIAKDGSDMELTFGTHVPGRSEIMSLLRDDSEASASPVGAGSAPPTPRAPNFGR